MKGTCAIALVVALLGSSVAGAQDTVVDSPQLMRRYVERLKIGSTVKVQLKDRERFTAVLMAVDDNGVTFKPKTRIPEPARQIAFDQIAGVEPKHSGMSPARTIAVGAGIGAATFFGIMLALFASLD